MNVVRGRCYGKELLCQGDAMGGDVMGKGCYGGRCYGKELLWQGDVMGRSCYGGEMLWEGANCMQKIMLAKLCKLKITPINTLLF